MYVICEDVYPANGRLPPARAKASTLHSQAVAQTRMSRALNPAEEENARKQLVA